MSPYPKAVCHHCMDPIEDFGGIWFVRNAGAVCYRSPDTQHRPVGRLLDVPPPRPPRPQPAKAVTAEKARAVLDALAVVLATPPLPASVIARGADTTCTHGASGRKRWH